MTIASNSLGAPALQYPGSQWPQRLLHVPTMTSLVREWDDDHAVYGGKTDPEYNILTYTWGRWAVDSGPALDIKGVSWKIPSINRAHFSVEDFQRVIRRISKTTEYVWLDVACIDQENGQVKMDEIRRQAAIFWRADRVFVWLNHCSTDELQACVNKANQSYQQYRDYLYEEIPDFNPREWIQSTGDAASRLFSDPWFSSLWTLQEAYLRQDAILLSMEASTVEYPESQFDRSTILHDLIFCYYEIYKAAKRFTRDKEQSLENPADRVDAQDIVSQIERSGLPPLHDGNPISIYGVACFRQATNPLDRIYGIMQIFGLTLGDDSRPAPGRSLESLERQLGEQLNLRSPVYAQLFLHIEPAPLGECWRISQQVRVPETARWAIGRYDRKIRGKMPSENFCSIWPTPEGLVRYKGYLCTFPLMFEFWRDISFRYFGQVIDSESSSHVPAKKLPERWAQSIFLDNSTLLNSQELDWPRESDEETNDRQEQVGKSLIECFGDKLRIGLVGKLNAQAQGLETGTIDIWAGVLLLPQFQDSRQYWVRIGFCLWELRQDEMTHRRLWKATECCLG
jgi:hypothetical protein